MKKIILMVVLLAGLNGCAVTVGLKMGREDVLCLPCITTPLGFDEISNIGFGIGFNEHSRWKIIFPYEDKTR